MCVHLELAALIVHLVHLVYLQGVPLPLQLLQLPPRTQPAPHVPPTPLLPDLAEDTIVTVPPTPLLPALVEGMAVIAGLPKQLQPLLPQLPQQPQPQRLQLQLSLSPPDLAGDITVTVPPTPQLPALVEGIIVILILPLLQLLPVNQEGGLRKMHQSAVVISKGNLVLEKVRYSKFFTVHHTQYHTDPPD